MALFSHMGVVAQAILAQGSKWLRVLVLVNGVELVLSRFCFDGEADLHERYDEISNEMKKAC